MDLKQSDGWRYLAGWSFILLMVASATLQHDAKIILPEIGALTACRSIADAIIIEGVKIEFGASLCYWLTANYH